MSSLALTGIAELVTNDPTLGGGRLGRRRDAGLVLDEGRVVWVGPSAQTPAADSGRDLEGRSVLPGFVDSHTHLIFGGERSAEFAARMAGAPYDGGGIAATVAATAAMSDIALLAHTDALLREMARTGTTCVEIKSGYALTVEGEARLCALAATVTEEVTFLGAHALPASFATHRQDYVDLVIGEMLATCAPSCRWADVFCESVAFDVDEARAILLAARGAGLELRLHGNQLGLSGGVGLACELGAASVDHCSYLDREDLDALSTGSTVATLLPTAELSTRGPRPPVRQLLEAGATVALATDCNPGTSYVTSMPLVVALAVSWMEMSVDEAIWAATAGGAAALRRPDLGHLSPGARGDLVVLDAPSADHLAYRPAANLVAGTLVAGSWRYDALEAR